MEAMRKETRSVTNDVRKYDDLEKSDSWMHDVNDFVGRSKGAAWSILCGIAHVGSECELPCRKQEWSKRRRTDKNCSGTMVNATEMRLEGHSIFAESVRGKRRRGPKVELSDVRRETERKRGMSA